MSNFFKIQELHQKLCDTPKDDVLERISITAKIRILQVDDANAALLEVRKSAKSIGYDVDLKTGELTKID